MAHSRSFLANQKARNAIVGAENLLRAIIPGMMPYKYGKRTRKFLGAFLFPFPSSFPRF